MQLFISHWSQRDRGLGLGHGAQTQLSRGKQRAPGASAFLASGVGTQRKGAGACHWGI